MPYRLIDPQEVLDYSCDWATFLAEAGSPGDSIDTSTWSIYPQEGSPSEPILSNDTVTGDVATVFVSNCAVGGVYRLSNKVVTTQGRTAERTWTLRCDQR